MSRGRGEAAPHAPPAPRERAPVVAVDDAGDSPILRGYRAVKAEHPDALVLVRLGDFFELFGDDAETGAALLGLTLTGRGFGRAGRVPMCGVPHHSVMQHVRRLLAAGHRVAVWDQVGGEGDGRLVERAVTRVLSPGIVVDDELVEPATVQRCVAVHEVAGRTGVAALDAAAGELLLFELDGGLDSPALRADCETLHAVEYVVSEDGRRGAPLDATAVTTMPSRCFDARRGRERLLEVTGTATLQGLGVDAMAVAHAAAAALLQHCERARLDVAHLRVRARDVATTMRLDPAARRALELFSGLTGDPRRSLAALLDRTRTPPGARLLRERLAEPLIDPEAIAQRLDAVAALVESPRERQALRDSLRGVRDIERLVTRCTQRLATPRDLAALRDSCEALPAVSAVLRDIAPLHAAAAACTAPPALTERLRATLAGDPPATARDGGAIRDGADSALDSLRAAGGDARAYLSSLEQRERERTGIRSLRVGYNRVFGYYIEIGNAHHDRVPADYVRKQTLVGAERYVTAELKGHEATVLGARERAIAREAELLGELVATVVAEAPALLDASRAIAVADVTQALAETAVALRWSRPSVDGGSVIDIEDGRHPLVEDALGPGRFVPNSCTLDGDGAQVIVLTGPNMAGKSTYLRQVACIVLLAQMGSFVPATRARIGVCDRIFTRVGAHDDLAGGMSTFMVEMAETATILNTATARSLVVLDEVGRGTSTYDGLAIARAVVEHLHDAPSLGSRTLFATHYHELCDLAAELPRVHNARVEVLEEGDQVTFLHRIVAGAADRSYGIHVARLAGVPESVVQRARMLLDSLERTPRQRRSGDQLVLALPPPAHPLVEQLTALDVESLTPLAALNTLAELRDRAAGC